MKFHYLQGFIRPRLAGFLPPTVYMDSYIHLAIWWQIEILHSIDTQKRLDYILYIYYIPCTISKLLVRSLLIQSQTPPLEGPMILRVDPFGATKSLKALNHLLKER